MRWIYLFDYSYRHRKAASIFIFSLKYRTSKRDDKMGYSLAKTSVPLQRPGNETHGKFSLVILCSEPNSLCFFYFFIYVIGHL